MDLDRRNNLNWWFVNNFSSCMKSIMGALIKCKRSKIRSNMNFENGRAE
jgi:hypothetical protein